MHAIFPKNTSRPNKVILGGTGVPISELLKRQECFQPTEVATLCAVFEDVLKTLGLIDRREIRRIGQARRNDTSLIRRLPLPVFQSIDHAQHFGSLLLKHRKRGDDQRARNDARDVPKPGPAKVY